MRKVLEAFLDECRAGRVAVLTTVVRATGSTPRGPGARMLVRPDGSTSGTIGGGAFEAMVIADRPGSRGATRSGAAGQALRLHGDRRTRSAWRGGTAEVLLESVGAGPRLVVFGAGHVGLALARLAATVGFRVLLVDDRAEACEAARRAGAGEVAPCGASWTEWDYLPRDTVVVEWEPWRAAQELEKFSGEAQTEPVGWLDQESWETRRQAFTTVKCESLIWGEAETGRSFAFQVGTNDGLAQELTQAAGEDGRVLPALAERLTEWRRQCLHVLLISLNAHRAARLAQMLAADGLEASFCLSRSGKTAGRCISP